MYSIKEATEKLGTTKHTLYYYEKIGLLPYIQRDEQGNRIYTDSDISWIYLIRCLRDINMPIKLIKDYVELLLNKESTLQDRKKMLLKFQKKVDEDLKKYLIIQQLITKKLEFYNIQENNLSSEAEECYNYKEDWEHFKMILEKNND